MRRFLPAVSVVVAACTSSVGLAPLVEAGGVSPEVVTTSLANGTALQAIAAAALSKEALEGNAAFLELLRWNPGATSLFSYMVQCALPPDRSVSLELDGGTTQTFPGAVGLAPAWETGACDVECQEWVTACILARTNAFRVRVFVYMTGPHPRFDKAIAPREAGYTVREGAFYGNFFLPQPRTYACRGDDEDPLAMAFRTCTRRVNDCGFMRVGTCGGVDGDDGTLASRQACDTERADGAYLGCADRATLPDSGDRPQPVRSYPRAITVFLRPTGFDAGKMIAGYGSAPGAVACGDTPVSQVTDPVDPGPAVAGSPCVNEDICDSELLHCDASTGFSLCTAACDATSSIEAEAAACGPGGTCLRGFNSTGFCTAGCRPGRRGTPEGCASTRICTRAWLNGGDSEPGCHPFCRSDADCAGTTQCNVRMGTCEGRFDPAALPDGTPCTLDGPPCRGVCFSVDEVTHQRLCASLVDLGRNEPCPDDPEHMVPMDDTRADDLGACVFRKCTAASDCAAPLTCRRLRWGKVCTYPLE